MWVLSHVRLFATTWTIGRQAPLSIGFPRQQYWSGFPFPSLGDLPNPGIKPESLVSPAIQADSLPLRHPVSLKTRVLLVFFTFYKWKCWGLITLNNLFKLIQLKSCCDGVCELQVPGSTQQLSCCWRNIPGSFQQHDCYWCSLFNQSWLYPALQKVPETAEMNETSSLSLGCLAILHPNQGLGWVPLLPGCFPWLLFFSLWYL